MKILFINKYDTHGGAAIAAWRLQEALYEKYRTDNRLLCGIKSSDKTFVYPTRKKGLENFLERAINFGMCRIGLQYFWFPFSTQKILQFTKEFNPDIISLHNLHGGFFKTSLFRQLSETAPLVWTLHDMWAFTANAAYSGGKENWKAMKSGKHERKQFPAIGLNTGDFLLKRKKRIYENSRLSVVCPSAWMAKQAGQSPALSGKTIRHIPNGVNLKKFTSPSSEKRQEIRKELGIEPGQTALLLFAEKISDERKGGKDLISILQQLDTPAHKNVVILTIGNGHFSNSYNYLQLIELGYLSGNAAITRILQASDLFIFPTHEDNLPNTLVEAIACGLPCATYDVGGCGEIIQDRYNGLLAPAGDTNAFYKNIKHVLQQPEILSSMRINARKYAEQHFDVQVMAERYYTLFNGLLKNP